MTIVQCFRYNVWSSSINQSSAHWVPVVICRLRGAAYLSSSVDRHDDDSNHFSRPVGRITNRKWTAGVDLASPSSWDEVSALSSPTRVADLKSTLETIATAEKRRRQRWTRKRQPMDGLETSAVEEDEATMGVFHRDRKEDIRLLVDNFTSPRLASAVRDREDTLQLCAYLLSIGDLDGLHEVMQPYEREFVESRRLRDRGVDLRNGFTTSTLEVIRKRLSRMPRQVTRAHQRRAAIVLPLCNVIDPSTGDIYPSIMLTKRSMNLRHHPGEVCLPGGKVCSSGSDRTIVSTSLREMKEETGFPMEEVNVLGILRCNWGEVAKLTGTAVTPVIGFIGDVSNADLKPNPEEVEECFTVPLSKILDPENWVYKVDPPIFNGCPYPVWGLTGYILDRFVKDLLGPYQITLGKTSKE